MTLDAFKNKIYSELFLFFKETPPKMSHNISKNFSHKFWQDIMESIYLNFKNKSNKERNKFVITCLNQVRENSSKNDLVVIVNDLKNLNDEELFWWFAVNDAVTSLMLAGIAG